VNDRIVVITPEPSPAERRAIEIALAQDREQRQTEPAAAPWLEPADVDR
jgi:hypothetical protein